MKLFGCDMCGKVGDPRDEWSLDIYGHGVLEYKDMTGMPASAGSIEFSLCRECAEKLARQIMGPHDRAAETSGEE